MMILGVNKVSAALASYPTALSLQPLCPAMKMKQAFKDNLAFLYLYD